MQVSGVCSCVFTRLHMIEHACGERIESRARHLTIAICKGERHVSQVDSTRSCRTLLMTDASAAIRMWQANHRNSFEWLQFLLAVGDVDWVDISGLLKRFAFGHFCNLHVHKQALCRFVRVNSSFPFLFCVGELLLQ